MLPVAYQEELEQQGYRIVGEHSAVKICGWTKNRIKDQGGCYKYAFYGINSAQCMQMTSSMSCANRCTFCWRGKKAPVAKEWQWGVDEPGELLDKLLSAHHKLLVGFQGNPAAPYFKDSLTVRHAALSLTGEPIIYPRINELIHLIHQKKISTFLVTNAQYPESLRDLEPVTQLYISLDAPSKELLKKIDRPLFADYWERYLDSLDILAQKRGRTAMRMTLIRGVNMIDPAGYAALIVRGNPDFVEVKAFMPVGSSREQYTHKDMPTSPEIKAFGEELLLHLPGYALVTEHWASRVVLLAKTTLQKNGVWHTWIDFDRFFTLDNPAADEYLAVTNYLSSAAGRQ